MATSSKSTFELSLYLCTYNVCTRDPEEDLSALLGLTDASESSDLPDLYGIGLQEVNAKPYAFLKDSLFDDPWTNEIKKLLKNHDYVKIRCERLQGLVLMLFAKRYHVTFIRDVKVSFTRTGLGGLWGNKGGVTIRFTVYGCSICIINSHLAAHDHGLQNRLEDHDAILDGPMFRECDTSLILDHELPQPTDPPPVADSGQSGVDSGQTVVASDSRSNATSSRVVEDRTHYVFWIGDLNFRISVLDVDVIEECIENKEYHILWEHDELLKCIQREDGFHWFTEGPLSFPPTYKFSPGTDRYATRGVSGRRPAWCDRVLWLVNDDAFHDLPLALKQRHYTSHGQYVTSDHKPVTSHFSLTIVAEFNEELVKFHPIHRWYLRQDAPCTYTVREYAQTSAWDWIGLYKSDFSSIEEYIMWVYSVSGGERKGYNGCQVTIPANKITQPDLYRLCYISSKRQCILGMSRAFQVVEQYEQELEDMPSTSHTVTNHNFIPPPASSSAALEGITLATDAAKLDTADTLQPASTNQETDTADRQTASTNHNAIPSNSECVSKEENELQNDLHPDDRQEGSAILDSMCHNFVP